MGNNTRPITKEDLITKILSLCIHVQRWETTPGQPWRKTWSPTWGQAKSIKSVQTQIKQKIHTQTSIFEEFIVPSTLPMLKKEGVNSTESGWQVIKTKSLREKNQQQQTKNKTKQKVGWSGGGGESILNFFKMKREKSWEVTLRFRHCRYRPKILSDLKI